MTNDLARFKQAMRRLASGVALITTTRDGTPHGLVATSVTSVSGEPPSLLVCVNRTASAHDPILEARVFCVNLLASHNEAVAGTFTDPARRADRFSVGTWDVLETGAPRLVGALASFDCEVAEAMVYGTHTIFIGNVRAIGLQTEGAGEPLLYLDGRYHRLATAAA